MEPKVSVRMEISADEAVLQLNAGKTVRVGNNVIIEPRIGHESTDEWSYLVFPDENAKRSECLFSASSPMKAIERAIQIARLG
jgi:hypothetical protein